MSRVLVTGGAGFIGSHLVDRLLAQGHDVRVLDHLEPPTHLLPEPLNLDPRAEFLHGSVGDEALLPKALSGIEAIFHLAATGGYRPGATRYQELNSLHTAKLVDRLGGAPHTVRRLIVASSVAVYGEGALRCATHGISYPEPRDRTRLEVGLWEMTCPRCGEDLEPVPTPEEAPVAPLRPYSLSKYDQERIVLNAAPELGIEGVALRYFVTYGPRQSLTNPYTGVISNFANRIRAGLPPMLYEDGRQSRDFICVSDLVEAHILALEAPRLPHRVMNVGTGVGTSVASLARTVAEALGQPAAAETPGRYRLGDVRHAVADISRISTLGFVPRVSLAEGVARTMQWFAAQPPVPDRFDEAERESRSLIGHVAPA